MDPETIDPSSHGPLRTIELPAFKSSRWAAMLATVLILAVAVMQIVQFNLAAQLVNQVFDGTPATEDQLIYVYDDVEISSSPGAATTTGSDSYCEVTFHLMDDKVTGVDSKGPNCDG